MTPPIPSADATPAPPWEDFRRQLLERASLLASSGDAAGAAVLRALVESWWRDQQTWNSHIQEVLSANHEINNALVGVSGNAQLLMMTPMGHQATVRERLQVVLRESERIERAVRRLQGLKVAFGSGDGKPDGTMGDGDGRDTANAA